MSDGSAGFVTPYAGPFLIDVLAELAQVVKELNVRLQGMPSAVQAAELQTVKVERDRLKAACNTLYDSCGEVVKMCPCCMASLHCLFRRYETNDWVCGTCHRIFAEPACYRRVMA